MAYRQGKTEREESDHFSGAESRVSDRSAIPDRFLIHHLKKARDPMSSAHLNSSLCRYVALVATEWIERRKSTVIWEDSANFTIIP